MIRSQLLSATLLLATSAGHVYAQEPPSVSQAADESDQDTDMRLDTLFGSHADYRAFFDKLKGAVAVSDKYAVAEMVNYPLQVHLHGKTLMLHSSHDLVEQYDRIFTPKLADLVKRQTYATLFARDEGIMLGEHGEIWFAGICEDKACQRVKIKITALNLDDA